jgi:dipeptidyl aminopeptidase/acylaminoacyl peptidase
MPIAIRRRVLIVVMAIFASIAHGAPPPIEAFGALPAIGDASLSPNGTSVVWSANQGNDTNVIVVDLTNNKVRRQIAVGAEYKLRDLEWADDDIVLMKLSQTESARYTNADRYRLEFYRTVAIDLKTGQATVLLMNDGARGLVNTGRIQALHTHKPKTIYMSSLDYSATAARGVVDSRLQAKRSDTGWIDVLFEVNTLTGKGKALERGTAYTLDWAVDPTGTKIARSEWNPEGFGYRVQVKRGASWVDVFARPKGPPLSIYGMNAEGTAIVAVGPDDKDRVVVFEIAIDGSGARVLYQHAESDIQYLITDRFTGVPVAAVPEHADSELYWLSSKAKARHDAVVRSFKGSRAEIYDESRDGKRVLARVDGVAKPGVYYLIDFEKRSADIVGEEYPALANVALGAMKRLTYTARDGTQIPAFLTLPPVSDGKNVPMVVLPHGGPHSQDDFAFDWWAQFLASRGYAVLQPQFRGSTGYGVAFEQAGYRQWGLRMQDDITDGVKAMVEQGVAHPARICIVGASYGGYAALAGAAFTPDLYRCAVSYAGISSIPQMLASDRVRWGEDHPSYIELVKRVGDPLDPALLASSPISAVERIKAPVLLIHGLDDIVVPAAQSGNIARALADRGANVRYVKLTGEDHWLSRASTRQQLLAEIEKFLAEHLAR